MVCCTGCAGRVCRRVECVNISPFIANLPFGKDTTSFSTPDASGSTSQASQRLAEGVVVVVVVVIWRCGREARLLQSPRACL